MYLLLLLVSIRVTAVLLLLLAVKQMMNQTPMDLHITAGMNIYAAVMLVPISVVTYTVIGGLKATFTSSYLHTVIIFVTLNLFVFKVTNHLILK